MVRRRAKAARGRRGARALPAKAVSSDGRLASPRSMRTTAGLGRSEQCRLALCGASGADNASQGAISWWCVPAESRAPAAIWSTENEPGTHLLVLDATGRRDPRREAASPDAASTAAEWAPDKALRCQTPWGCPRKAAAGQAAQPPLGKAARLRGRRPSAPKAVATEEGPQAPERPPGALPDEAAREASTGRAVGVVAATAAAAALGPAAKSEGAAGTRRGPNLWTKNERQNPGG
ncbi:testis-specific gene A8 protein-like [Schistocerca americana]|uniref:testis-specific gene A8 protein-like n=1 Tax=Schistocerca americana TaxID=7009 RepID=UPI001F504064|nr:testis-specific gene A8 protein-like [Schistocerca americana]